MWPTGAKFKVQLIANLTDLNGLRGYLGLLYVQVHFISISIVKVPANHNALRYVALFSLAGQFLSLSNLISIVNYNCREQNYNPACHDEVLCCMFVHISLS